MDDRGAAILTVRANSQQYDRTADILHGHRLMETTQMRSRATKARRL